MWEGVWDWLSVCLYAGAVYVLLDRKVEQQQDEEEEEYGKTAFNDEKCVCTIHTVRICVVCGAHVKQTKIEKKIKLYVRKHRNMCGLMQKTRISKLHESMSRPIAYIYICARTSVSVCDDFATQQSLHFWMRLP